MVRFLNKIFGDPQSSKLKDLYKQVEVVNKQTTAIEKLSDRQLQDKTAEFKKRIEDGESLDDILPEAFSVVREASWRVLKMKHFDVQIMGGIVLHGGNVAEMRTGEGKTLVATSAVYLNAITGKGCLLYTSPSPRDATLSRMPSSA